MQAAEKLLKGEGGSFSRKNPLMLWYYGTLEPHHQWNRKVDVEHMLGISLYAWLKMTFKMVGSFLSLVVQIDEMALSCLCSNFVKMQVGVDSARYLL